MRDKISALEWQKVISTVRDSTFTPSLSRKEGPLD